MGRVRIVVPAVVRLPLSEGDFIDCKAELNAGEYLDLLSAITARDFFAKTIAYLVGWSFVDTSGAPVPYHLRLTIDERRATLRALDAQTLHEILAAIDEHEAAQEAAREEKKTAPVLASAS